MTFKERRHDISDCGMMYTDYIGIILQSIQEWKYSIIVTLELEQDLFYILISIVMGLNQDWQIAEHQVPLHLELVISMMLE